jgi:hypothetical protein
MVRNLAAIGPRGSPPELLFGDAKIGLVLRGFAQMEPLMKYTNAQECHQYLVAGDQGSTIHGVQCVEQGHLQTRFYH